MYFPFISYVFLEKFLLPNNFSLISQNFPCYFSFPDDYYSFLINTSQLFLSKIQLYLVATGDLKGHGVVFSTSMNYYNSCYEEGAWFLHLSFQLQQMCRGCFIYDTKEHKTME